MYIHHLTSIGNCISRLMQLCIRTHQVIFLRYISVLLLLLLIFIITLIFSSICMYVLLYVFNTHCLMLTFSNTCTSNSVSPLAIDYVSKINLLSLSLSSS